MLFTTLYRSKSLNCAFDLSFILTCRDFRLFIDLIAIDSEELNLSLLAMKLHSLKIDGPFPESDWHQLDVPVSPLILFLKINNHLHLFIKIELTNGLSWYIFVAGFPFNLLQFEIIDKLSRVGDIFKTITGENVSLSDRHAFAVTVEQSLDRKACHVELEIMLMLENVFWLWVV